MKKLLFVAALLTGCVVSHTSLDVASYKSWYKQNVGSITDTQTVNSVRFSLREFPYEWDYLQNNQSEAWKSAEKQVKADKLLRYMLRVELPVQADIYHYNLNADTTHTERAAYYAFDVKNDVKLITRSKDTIDCQLVKTEQAVSNYPLSTFIIEFGGVDRKMADKIIFTDRFLSEQTVVFPVSKFSIITLPSLASI